ncbi:iron complex outermembrane receptor protein/outer membrane receptor for ferrienterochelin and colicins [Litorimonas taeanensis]|uniref:Iron complex outermembrane receptor protein/outer membrane receptor for ferrienterochelin and colicins n=1 Tax=Litorimonas taeanensis TaxID=568099 RepID=A0A420WKZ8_9PROT|nr:TonB-dependent receptor [Litorimonas taeanensis]RKQ71697.1 iron complex outermembrane receptor protein/outer membrane receptor for ferrienterochelin and colicins [Litorimonas taeanensis]
MSSLLRHSAILIALTAVTFHHGYANAQPPLNTSAPDDTKPYNEHDDDHHDDHHDDVMDEVVVQATRSGRTLNDEPIRVEIINQEEIAEKAAMRPGNISMLVAEIGGVRVQTTSPALGSANIRLQGLYGRYTQLLSDGLPLYGGQAASIGLLQIPPTDLAQVEVIKGSASSFYGGSALGGVINLISRRPHDDPNGEVLLNFTSENGQDLTGYYETPLSNNFSASLTAGAHRQSVQDFDDDGWIDMAGYERFTARPRLFWNGSNGTNIYATFGFMTEQRDGGTLHGAVVPDGTSFTQNQDTTRLDGGFIADIAVNDSLALNVRGSAMLQDHTHQFGSLFEDDSHDSYLAEVSLSGDKGKTNWVLGAAIQSEKYVSDTFPAFDYSYDVPGVFVQLDQDLNDTVSVSLSGRLDEHSEFGTQFSPRASVLYKPGDWTIRGSYGQGYFAPTPFVEDIEAAGLSRLEPLSSLEEETAHTASFDIGYKRGAIETNISLFSSQVKQVTELEAFASTISGPLDRVRLVNAEGETNIKGGEFLLRYYWKDLKLTGSYLYLDATEQDPLGGRREIDLTPQHSAGFVAMWEQHGRGRLGFEAYYTGQQSLSGNPYRNESNPYWHLGLLGEITLGATSWFINAENLLDIRQTKDDPLVLPMRAPDGQWTTSIWSRNDGFIVNGGVRVKF